MATLTWRLVNYVIGGRNKFQIAGLFFSIQNHVFKIKTLSPQTELKAY
jgi:hypothetical protein